MSHMRKMVLRVLPFALVGVYLILVGSPKVQRLGLALLGFTILPFAFIAAITGEVRWRHWKNS